MYIYIYTFIYIYIYIYIYILRLYNIMILCKLNNVNIREIAKKPTELI